MKERARKDLFYPDSLGRPDLCSGKEPQTVWKRVYFSRVFIIVPSRYGGGMESLMKPRKHKRKESFSVLLISNTGLSSRQIHISRSLLRGLAVLLLLVCVVCGWLGYQYWNGYRSGSRNMAVKGNEDASSEELLEKIALQEEQVRLLEAEKAELNSQKDALTTENKALLEAAKANRGEAAAEDSGNTDTKETEPDAAGLGLYPYSEQGDVSVKYSEDHPYVSIDTHNGGNVIAAGDGTVATVGSDGTYPLIIEIEHESGYRTRYLFLQEAESLLQEGTQVQAGDTLATLDANNTQLDYQVIFEGNPVDPLDVFEAKG